MPPFSTLTVTTLRQAVQPLLRVEVQLVVQAKSMDNRAMLAQLVPISCQRVGLAPFAGTAQRTALELPGKVQSFRLTKAEPVRLLLTVSKVVKGKPSRRTMLFSCGPMEEQGRVRLRHGGSSITLLGGPLRRIQQDEAQELLGGVYVHALEYKASDLPRFGLTLEGMTPTAAPRAITTVGEQGVEETVFVSRKPRRISSV